MYIYIYSVEKQNLSPQSMSLCHADYFELKKKSWPKKLRRTFDFPLNWLKNVDRETLPGNELSIDNYNMNCMYRQGRT